jgi:diacylglycerol kinase (ATP)
MSKGALGKFIRGFGHAGRGVLHAFREQRNFRVHCAITLAVPVAGVVLRLTYIEWLFIVFAIGLVLGAELLNSAIEALGDAITREHHPLIGQAKDLGAAGVLVCAIAAAVIGGIIFGRHILLLLAQRP